MLPLPLSDTVFHSRRMQYLHILAEPTLLVADLV